MRNRLLSEDRPRSSAATISGRFHRARAHRELEGGFTLVEMTVALAIVTTIVGVILGVVTNLFTQSQVVHDTVLGVQQDQVAGVALTQYLHSTIVILPGSNATTLKASILAGINSSDTPQTATLTATLTNSASPTLDATFTTTLQPDGGNLSTVNTYDAVNSSAVFTYYYNNYSAAPVVLASTTSPTNAQLSQIVAVGIDVTFLAGPHKPTVGYQAIRASSFETTVYLQNAAGAPAPTTSVSIGTSGTVASGQPLTVNATVNPVPDGGSITFTVTDPSSNVLSVCTGSVDVNVTTGVASCTFTPSSGGTYYVTGAFSGTSDFQPSTSPNTAVPVPIATTIAIPSGGVTSPSHGTLTVVANVSPAAATGSVSFTLKQTSGCYGSCPSYSGPATLSSGTATFTQSGLSSGHSYSISATYPGNGVYGASGPATSTGTPS